ncbi:MAG: hypothetical protein IKE43_11040 [Coriobacteriales bacterium]|nr:hypothetical protein [Coriobacteriales bacterium]
MTDSSQREKRKTLQEQIPGNANIDGTSSADVDAAMNETASADQASDTGDNIPPASQSSWTRFFSRRIPNVILRTIVLVLGFAWIAMGVAMSRHTGMGTSPISCVPCVLSFVTPITIGTYTMILNTLFVIAQIAMLRKQFNPLQLLQIPCTLVFSVFIDAFVPLAEKIPLPNYAACMALMLVSICFTAIGVFLEVRAYLIPLPGEGVSTTASRVFGVEFPRCKLIFDVSNVLVGTVLSLVFLHGLYGVREGTILAAIAVGPLVRVIGKLLPNFEQIVPVQGKNLFLSQ